MKNNIQEIIKKANNIHNNYYSYDKSIYVNSKTKIIITCPKHGDFEQNINKHLNGQGCPKCKGDKISKIKKIKINDVIIKSEKVYPKNSYEYNNLKYNNLHDIVEIKCIKHNIIFKQELNSHLRGYYGCPYCKKENHKYVIPINKKTTEIFNLNATLIHDYKYDYSLVDYENNVSKIKIICIKHGIFEQSPNKHLSGSGCPKCRESKGEKNIKHFLEKNNIKYISQKRFNECRYKNPLPFDFYLPEYNICIEFDGEQHFKVVDYLGGIKGFNDRKRRDLIKNEYCNNNNIRLIRISYKDDINNKLISIFIN